ncbi:MAG: ParB/RepB/Spo0J family partition protein, partial [Candidatus Moranbacteria bacterium]|nr:ParB/RepB/Spo0J family partition protein [Candidatus Moranbacteria bacterium]
NNSKEVDEEGAKNGKVKEIPLKKIVVNKNQPRKDFDLEKLEALAKSINQYGLLNPITVKQKKDGSYEIIAGERRFRAAKLSGIEKIPAIIKEVDKGTQLELALIENIQREDLNPMEEATAYKTLIKDFGLTQEEVANRVGKARSSVANFLRFLNLPKEIQDGLAKGEISEGHAKVILTVRDADFQIELFERVKAHNLTVRNLENIIKHGEDENFGKPKETIQLSPLLLQRERKLADSLGLKVKIKPKTQGGGSIVLEYFNEDDLDRLIQMLETQEE